MLFQNQTRWRRVVDKPGIPGNNLFTSKQKLCDLCDENYVIFDPLTKVTARVGVTVSSLTSSGSTFTIFLQQSIKARIQFAFILGALEVFPVVWNISVGWWTAPLGLVWNSADGKPSC